VTVASLGCAPFSIMRKFLQKNLSLLHFLSCESDNKSLCLVCSVLSYYGVHSFPIVFMHNRTSRVRYYGSRTLEAFTYFYQNYTGEEHENWISVSNFFRSTRLHAPKEQMWDFPFFLLWF
jgi:hypothetical protein